MSPAEINGAPILQVEDVAGRLSAVNDLIAILDAATVDRVRHGGSQGPDILRAALVHSAAVLDAFRCQPERRFRKSPLPSV